MTPEQFSLAAVGLILLLAAVVTARRAGRLPHGTLRARRHVRSAALAFTAAVLLLASSVVGFLD